MKLQKYFLVCLLALSGCKYVEFKNGEVPEEHLHLVQQYEGDYVGKFDGTQGVLSLSLDGQKPVLVFTDKNGDKDILGDDCNSQIGKITGANLKEKNKKYQIESAYFAFDTGSCSLQGNSLIVSPTLKEGVVTLNVKILERSITVSDAPNCDNNGCWGGGGSSTHDIYLYGKFTKQ